MSVVLFITQRLKLLDTSWCISLINFLHVTLVGVVVDDDDDIDNRVVVSFSFYLSVCLSIYLTLSIYLSHYIYILLIKCLHHTHSYSKIKPMDVGLFFHHLNNHHLLHQHHHHND